MAMFEFDIFCDDMPSGSNMFLSASEELVIGSVKFTRFLATLTNIHIDMMSLPALHRYLHRACLLDIY